MADELVDDELLDMLVCPVTRSRLVRVGDELVGTVGGLRYPIRDGIPVLLPSEATLPAGMDSLQAFEQRYADAKA